MTIREELIDLAPDYDVEVRAYSGRFMYGAECLGLVGYPDDLWRLTQIAAVESGQTIEPPKRDSMGRDHVVWYWKAEPPPGDG